MVDSNSSEINKIVSYEIVDGKGDYVTAYSFDLKKNSNGKLDPLKMAQDTLKYKQDYKLFEVYENGFRKEI
jgi:hypothetical protein